MDEFTKYQALQANGSSPRDLYLVAKSDGLDTLARIRMLRRVCQLSLVDAKEVSVVAEQRADSLDAHQQRLVEPLERALTAADVAVSKAGA